MGAAGVELDAAGDLAPQRLSQTGRRELAHLLASNNLALTALNCPLRHGLDTAANQEARIDHVRQVMSLSFELGARVALVPVGRIAEEDSVPQRRCLTESLTALGRHGDRIGAALALETGLESPARLETFLARFDSGSLAFSYNPAGLLINGHDPYEAIGQLGRRIVHVHAMDARTTMAGRIAQAQQVPLGHGELDWLRILARLEEIDYRGWLTVVATASADPGREAGNGIAFLQQLVR